MKYYTAFIYADTTPQNPIHCTHVYFGEIPDYVTARIVGILDTYFHTPTTFPQVDFAKPEFFGKNKDIRVLLPEVEELNIIFEMLRSLLLCFIGEDVDRFDRYRPHVTTEKDRVDAPFLGYALMSGSEVVRFWK